MQANNLSGDYAGRPNVRTPSMPKGNAGSNPARHIDHVISMVDGRLEDRTPLILER